jgi:hypothetical protein
MAAFCMRSLKASTLSAATGAASLVCAAYLSLLMLVNSFCWLPPHPPLQAKLHEAQGQRSAAAHYYALNLARLDAEGVTGTDATEALLYLAEYAKVSRQLHRHIYSHCKANRTFCCVRDCQHNEWAQGAGGGGVAAAAGSDFVLSLVPPRTSRCLPPTSSPVLVCCLML